MDMDIDTPAPVPSVVKKKKQDGPRFEVKKVSLTPAMCQPFANRSHWASLSGTLLHSGHGVRWYFLITLLFRKRRKKQALTDSRRHCSG